MSDNQLPLVSVPVIAYNSSKTIVETLDSIFNQTYPNLELIVSDDGSTDNTVQVCREWMETNKDRFVRTELLTVEKNTGITANCNRGANACQGEWVKGIAGDDLLMPDCIADFVSFINAHHDAKYVFGRMCFFGANETAYEKYKNTFKYDFFSWTTKQQLDFLVYERNCIPSPASFYSRTYIDSIGFRNDERIPLLEDWPKWIKLLQLGVKFYFLDKEVVSYRVDSGISTQSVLSVGYFKSNVLFDLLYRYPLWIEDNKDMAVSRMADFISEQYRARVESEKEVERLHHTSAYRLGKFLLKPFLWIKHVVIKRNSL